MAKSISIKDAERRSGDSAGKAVELTSGDLRLLSRDRGLGKSEGNPIAAQKSAAGIVGCEPEGPNGGSDVGVKSHGRNAAENPDLLACASEQTGEARMLERQGPNRSWRDTNRQIWSRTRLLARLHR